MFCRTCIHTNDITPTFLAVREMSQISGLGGKFQTAKNNGFSSRKSGKRLKMKFKEDKQCKNAKKYDSKISFHVHFNMWLDTVKILV